MLKLKQGIISESGLYTCKWTITAGAPTATLNVRVMGWAVTGDIGGKTYGVDGSLVVACKYTGIQPGTVTWLKGGTALKKGDKISMSDGELTKNAATYRLTISEAVPDTNEGKYTCVMTYDDGYKKSAETEAVVRTAAVVEGSSDTAVSSLLVTDATLAMKCIYKGKDLPKGVTWFYGSKEVTIDGSSTTVSNVVTSGLSEPVKVFQSSAGLGVKTIADEGKYSCRFHLSDGQDPTAEADVKVVSVTTPEVCVFIDYGTKSKETLTCTYTGSSAALSFAKKFPNKAELVAGELSKYVDSKQTGSFELIDITNEKEGTYECIFGLADNRKVSKKIQVSPRKADISTSVGTLSPRLLVGSSITLTCSIASGAKSITWFQGGTELTKYDVVEQTSEKFSISFDVENDGSYTCKGIYFSDDCPKQYTFESPVVKLEAIKAEPTTQPKDVAVNVDEKASFECVFPDPYGESKTPVIDWRAGSKLLLNGDLYNDQGVKIVDGEVTSKRNPGTYTTILTIAKVTVESAGEYMCSIKWDTLFIHSKPAHLVVRRITTAPSTVNVPNNVEARLTCVAVADTVATITFHLASDDSPVNTVESSDDSATTKTSMKTTTGVLKIQSPKETNYYCKATWGGHSVKSDKAYVNVLNYDENKVTDVWEAVGNTAKQLYYYEDKLMASSTAALKGSDGRDMHAATSVMWEYDKSGTWTGIADNSKITAGSSYRDRASDQRVTEVSVGPLTSDQTEVKLAAKITYTADPTHNLIGGMMDTKNHVIKVKVIKITTFQLPTDPAYQGDTITLSCSATGPSKPTFKFTVGGLPLSRNFFSEVAAPTSVVDGSNANLFKSEYKISIRAPNVVVPGQSVVCEAEFPSVSRTVMSESKELKTYYRCDSTESKAKITLLKDDYATKIFGSLQADGSLTASTQCNANTANEKYTKAEKSANSDATSTCSRDTGMWTPPFLVPCLVVQTFAQARLEQTYDLKDWKDSTGKNEVCNDQASAELTEAKIVEYMTSTDNAKCGARHVVPCLKKNDGTCSIKSGAGNAGCSWNKATKKLDIFIIITFSPILESIKAKQDAVNVASGESIKFFDCTSNSLKRNAMLIEILDRGPVDTNCIISNSTTIDAGDSPIDMLGRSPDEKAAKFRLILIVGAVCFAAFVILATTLFVKRRKSEKSKTLNIELFPGKLVISDA